MSIYNLDISVRHKVGELAERHQKNRHDAYDQFMELYHRDFKKNVDDHDESAKETLLTSIVSAGGAVAAVVAAPALALPMGVVAAAACGRALYLYSKENVAEDGAIRELRRIYRQEASGDGGSELSRDASTLVAKGWQSIAQSFDAAAKQSEKSASAVVSKLSKLQPKLNTLMQAIQRVRVFKGHDSNHEDQWPFSRYNEKQCLELMRLDGKLLDYLSPQQRTLDVCKAAITQNSLAAAQLSLLDVQNIDGLSEYLMGNTRALKVIQDGHFDGVPGEIKNAEARKIFEYLSAQSSDAEEINFNPEVNRG